MPGNLFREFFALILLNLYGMPLFAQPIFSDPQPLPREINSEFEESLPLLFGKTLYFVRSFYPNNTGGIDAGQDIWSCEKLGDNVWSKPSNSFPFFNNTDNNAVIGISRDGNRIYLMNSFHLSEGKSIRIEVSEKQNNNWTIPKSLMIKGISAEGKFSGFYMHPDEKALLLSMKGEDSYGEEDIYVCLLDQWGRWSKPLHLGKTLNTPGYEISPFLSNDTKTIYFSSNGHPDSKNADIFCAMRLDNSWKNWSEPVRLPENVNSDAFDAYFFLSENNEAFFVSNRNGNYTDIYSAIMLEPIANLQARKNGDSNEKKSNLMAAQHLQPETPNSDINERDEKLNPGIFDNKGSALVYFEFASAELSEGMKEILKFIAEQLREKPDYLVELSGYADDLGPVNYNKILSRKRAESVKQYLVEQGLDDRKIIPFGKGMLGLGESDDADAEREKNRRVEVVILN